MSFTVFKYLLLFAFFFKYFWVFYRLISKFSLLGFYKLISKENLTYLLSMKNQYHLRKE